MPPTTAKTGLGIQFAIGDGIGGGSVTYAQVGEVVAITMPEISRDLEDVTHLESPDDFKESIGALLDASECSITFNYVADAADVLYTKMLSGDIDVQITYKNGVKLQLTGIVTKWKPGDASPAKMQGTFAMKPSAKPILVAA